MKTETIKLMESELPESYSKSLFYDINYDIAPEHTDKIAETIFNSVSDVLSSVSATNNQPVVAYVFNNVDKSFICAAILERHKNDNGPDNVTLSWTFNEADVPEEATRYSLEDTLTHKFFISYASKWGMEFKDSSCLCNLCIYFFIHLVKWLDENASDSKEITITLNDVFEAKVAIEDNEKVMAIVPLGEVKNLAKNDEANEQ